MPLDMPLDEALAIYLFLRHRAPGTMTYQEEAAMKSAWHTIFNYAQVGVYNHMRPKPEKVMKTEIGACEYCRSHMTPCIGKCKGV